MDHEGDSSDEHGARSECCITVLVVVQPGEEVLRSVGEIRDGPVWDAELPVELVSHIRRLQLDRGVVGGEHHRPATQLVQLRRHRTPNHDSSVPRLRAAAWEACDKSVGSSHCWVGWGGCCHSVGELREGNPAVDEWGLGKVRRD
jgi:hypothetical protein